MMVRGRIVIEDFMGKIHIRLCLLIRVGQGIIFNGNFVTNQYHRRVSYIILILRVSAMMERYASSRESCEMIARSLHLSNFPAPKQTWI